MSRNSPIYLLLRIIYKRFALKLWCKDSSLNSFVYLDWLLTRRESVNTTSVRQVRLFIPSFLLLHVDSGFTVYLCHRLQRKKYFFQKYDKSRLLIKLVTIEWIQNLKLSQCIYITNWGNLSYHKKIHCVWQRSQRAIADYRANLGVKQISSSFDGSRASLYSLTPLMSKLTCAKRLSRYLIISCLLVNLVCSGFSALSEVPFLYLSRLFARPHWPRA